MGSNGRYEDFKRENYEANRNIVSELKMLYRTYFWQRFELYLNSQEIEAIAPTIRLSYVRGGLGFYNLYNLNYILRLEVENIKKDRSFSAENYWITRREQYKNMNGKERQREMQNSVSKYIDESN